MSSIITMNIGGVYIYTGSIGKELPLPRPSARSTEHLMRQGNNGPGIRVVQMLGSHPSYDNVDFTLWALSSSQISSLESLYRNQESFLWTIYFGNQTKQYRVNFADNGFTPKCPNLAKYDENVFMADLEFRIMENL